MSGASEGGVKQSSSKLREKVKGIKKGEWEGERRRKVKPLNSYLMGLISSFLQPDVG